MQNLEFFKLSGKPHMISKAVDNLTEYRKKNVITWLSGQ